LRISPTNGDTVYYDIGGEATTASAKLDGATLRTAELRVSFLAVDSTSVHETGRPVTWTNRITLKRRFFDGAGGRKMELQVAPAAAVRYTSDGSDPKVAGAVYDGPFSVPAAAQFVLAYAEMDGVASEVERYLVPADDGKTGVEVDKARPVVWTPGRGHAFGSTRDSYDFLERLKKYGAAASGVSLLINGEGGDPGWAELQFHEAMRLSPEQIETCLAAMRGVQTSGQVRLVAAAVHLPTGQALLDWVEEVKATLKSGEFTQ